MKYRIKTTNRFDKQLKLCEKRGLDMHRIFDVMQLLSQNGSLPKEYCPHPLKGDHKGQWECHIQQDWLMTWEQHDRELTLLFLETGTHADLFGW